MTSTEALAKALDKVKRTDSIIDFDFTISNEDLKGNIEEIQSAAGAALSAAMAVGKDPSLSVLIIGIIIGRVMQAELISPELELVN